MKSVNRIRDLKNDFDSVSHHTLLKRLHECGVRSIALQLFKSYLTNHTQRVRVDGKLSNKLTTTYGIPQGAILGPILCLISVNRLCKIKLNGEIISFTDDTALVFTGHGWEETKRIAKVGLRSIKQWLDANLLAMNCQKTNFLCFSPTIQGQPTYYYLNVHTCLDKNN